MNRIIRKLYIVFLKIIPKKYYDKYIELTIAILKKTNVLEYAYNAKGILKWENEIVSGESNVLNSILPKYIKQEENIVLFDVGANKGNYSLMMRQRFPLAKIYSFEPNPFTFKILKENLKETAIKTFNWGFGSEQKKENIYVYKNDKISEHASLYKEFAKVISSELGEKEVFSIEIEIKTIDGFCNEMNIENIDFIKIDVEGHEFAVLQGAINMIRQNKIRIIQFEFNVANIISKVFLKEFYDLLNGDYEFYRLDTHRLIYLGGYDSANEIFKFQNILAINKITCNEKYF
jgi:FkbM family methyltransferase